MLGVSASLLAGDFGLEGEGDGIMPRVCTETRNLFREISVNFVKFRKNSKKFVEKFSKFFKNSGKNRNNLVI